MYSEVIGGKIVQTVSEGAPITTQDGVQYPADYPKADIPNLVAVVDPGAPDPTLNEVTATDYQIVNGVPTVVYTSTPIPLATIQAQQIGVIRAARLAAESADLAYKTAGGVSSTFPMDSETRADFHYAYTTYVLGGVALPAGFAMLDSNGNAVAATVADLKGLFEAAMSRGVGYIAQEAARIASIKAAATPADVLAITW